jgi:hypothetical protein
MDGDVSVEHPAVVGHYVHCPVMCTKFFRHSKCLKKKAYTMHIIFAFCAMVLARNRHD